MKKQSLLLLAVLISFTALSQNVGIGTTTPNSSSMLEIKSNSKGLLIPRTSTASRTAIVNPAKGLIVYDTTTGSFWFHNGSAWTQIETRGNNWSLKGNSGTNPATNFIGTTDAKPLLFKVNNLPAGIIDSSNGNTAFGLNTLDSNTSGTSNTASGANALRLNTTGYSNTANGLSALYSNSTGYANTANGGVALLENTTGIENTADGYGALQFNTTGNYNTANGFRALYSNNAASSNTANGYQALYSNSTGYVNTANGAFALYSNTTGVYNTANGVDALYSNTTGDHNTATGEGALYSNTTGVENTANGTFALNVNTTGNSNTANGYLALFLNTTGTENTAIGNGALYYNSSGSYNTGVGLYTLASTTTAEYNTAIGYHAGYTGDLGYNNTFLGANCGTNQPGLYNDIAIGQAVICTDVSQARIGNSATSSIGGFANWSNISDGRYKNDVQENVKGIDFIMKLRPVTYHLDVAGINQKLYAGRSKEVDGSMNASMKQSIAEKEKTLQTGFIAQEVVKAAEESGYDFSGVDKPKNDNGFYGLRYAEFVVPLVKGMQEQQQQIEALKNQNAELIKRIEALEKK